MTEEQYRERARLQHRETFRREITTFEDDRDIARGTYNITGRRRVGKVSLCGGSEMSYTYIQELGPHDGQGAIAQARLGIIDEINVAHARLLKNWLYTRTGKRRRA